MKITKRQLRRIIKEEKRKLLREGSSAYMDLQFALDEYIAARVAEGETDPSAIHREIIDVADNLLADAELDGAIDTSRY